MLNENQIIKAVDDAYAKSNETMLEKAKKVIETLQYSLNEEMLGEHDYQVDTSIEVVESYKDEGILDEVQNFVLIDFTDGHISDLEQYDETCDLRSEYQDEINFELDEVIQKLKLHKTVYAIWCEGQEEFVDCFNTENDAKAEAESDVNYKIHKLQLISFDFDEVDDDSSSDNPNYETSMTVRIDGKVEKISFYVQLLEGYYLPQQGCLLSGKAGSDGGFNKVEKIVLGCFDVAELTEDYAREVIANRFVYHETCFNCSINNTSVRIREDKSDSKFEIAVMNDDFSKQGYVPRTSALYGDYDSLEDAKDFCQQFSTGEFHDFRGLKEILVKINE